MRVAIIKYNAGNIYSVYCACRRLGCDAVITDDPATIREADRVIFPGVGEAKAAMEYLNQKGLADLIRSLTQPVLGICIGMQLLCSHSEEGDVDCLGIFDVPVIRFRPSSKDFKVPQMGWNTIERFLQDEGNTNSLFVNLHEGDYVYYVHSYHVPLCAYTIAQTDYDGFYSAALHKGNFWATQFHPEKSGSVGEQILRNFLS
ncbi:MAG: imidazole glycerol phosphate synthase subunit HisH [Bacteroidales bacterium]|nr:imidazole glycerol phosphate synthase subunit HisH [Bacteroidales bacterium]